MEGPEYLGWITAEAENERTALMGATTYWLMCPDSPRSCPTIRASPH